MVTTPKASTSYVSPPDKGSTRVNPMRKEVLRVYCGARPGEPVDTRRSEIGRDYTQQILRGRKKTGTC